MYFICMDVRKIIHVDMDAFYASVEQRDHPELRGKPVIVGGSPEGRGVVATASYEARKYGVHSAMPAARARRLCPDGIFVKPRFEVYKDVSRQIRQIFLDYTDLVEPLSLDEAYLDVTNNKFNIPSATLIAREIKTKIKEQTGLTASAGVAPNKFLAKVASDYHKPDGLTLVTPERAEEFIEILPIGKFHGIGRVTEKKMKKLGIQNGRDLKRREEHELVRHFGKFGSYLYKIARGIDEREVKPNRIRKSLGAENTFAEDYEDIGQMKIFLESLANEVSHRLSRAKTGGRTITLKVRYNDFSRITRSLTVNESVSDEGTIASVAKDLLDQTEAGQRKVRLLGITVSSLDNNDDELIDGIQLDLFEEYHLKKNHYGNPE